VQLVHIIFNRYEPRSIPTIAALTVVLPSALSLLLFDHGSLVQAWMLTFSIFTGSLLGSVAIYRLSPFHPLARYPGPILGKVSGFWMVWITSRGKRYLYIQSLHNKYGDVVRIGESMLCIHIP
jgi:hypothetical protein